MGKCTASQAGESWGAHRSTAGLPWSFPGWERKSFQGSNSESLQYCPIASTPLRNMACSFQKRCLATPQPKRKTYLFYCFMRMGVLPPCIHVHLGTRVTYGCKTLGIEPWSSATNAPNRWASSLVSTSQLLTYLQRLLHGYHFLCGDGYHGFYSWLRILLCLFFLD